MTSFADASSPLEYAPRHALIEASRPTPLEWARRRREERESRRVAAANQRAAHRFAPLPDWHVVDVPRPLAWGQTDRQLADNASFLAIGPGGVFAVTVADHGRARVLLAGDVVQVNGRRPPYIAEARREAKRTAVALSKAVGSTVPVVPVLVLVGNGPVSYYGLPKDCLVSTYRELARVLSARGDRITPSTAAKLSAVARHPTTWGITTQPNSVSRLGQEEAEMYSWYPAEGLSADKRSTQR